MVSDIVRRTRVYELIRNRRQKRLLASWNQAGQPVPPPHLYKQMQLRRYAEQFSLDVLLETGTCLGDMVYAVQDAFSEIYSVELDEVLFQRASDRLSRFRHISVMQGDSISVLPRIVPRLTRPCLFWLDAHYSGGATARGKLDTPIVEELRYILESCPVRHVILIDDAREFTGSRDYPALDQVRGLVVEKHRDWTVEVEHDIVRIHEPGD